jgi:adenylyltransferase/sulfurtransferase
MAELSDAQIERYARHLILDEIGEAGQAKLLESRVLVVGAGGLGAPVLLYLAAAGVGTLGIVDDDVVELSNLQRQVIHRTADLGQRKVDSAARALEALDPGVHIVRHAGRLDPSNVDRLIADYDIIADGSDNAATRYVLNDACVAAQKTLVSGAILRFDGQLSTFKPHAGPAHPCYRCLYPEPPPEDLVPRCEAAGILGAVAGIVGTLQATEILKEILGLGESLSGTLLMIDALVASSYRVRIARNPNCPSCGKVQAL